MSIDPDEPEYYKASESDFYTGESNATDTFERLKDLATEKEINVLVRTIKETDNDTMKECAFQIIFPEWMCSPFFKIVDTMNMSAQFIVILTICMSSVIMLGISMNLLEEGYIRKMGILFYVFVMSLLFGVLGSWVLAEAVYEDVAIVRTQSVHYSACFLRRECSF
jgi:hypothetical protein